MVAVPRKCYRHLPSLQDIHTMNQIFALQENGEQWMQTPVESNLSFPRSTELVDKPNSCHLTKTINACLASHQPGTQLIIMPKNNTSINTLMLIHFCHHNFRSHYYRQAWNILNHKPSLLGFKNTLILYIHHSNLYFHLRLVRKILIGTL